MTMKTMLKRLAVALAISAILLSSVLPNTKIVCSSSSGVTIDLFSEKEHFNGKGPNVPCDAFGPEENVVLCALVTYDDVPVENLLVAFSVRPPTNVAFGLTARTGPDGIARVNFTISTPSASINESDVFGVWLAHASALMSDEVYQDTMSFKVDWIVKLISARAIDENLTTRVVFGIGGEVGLEIALRSVSMIVRSAVLSVIIKDELNVPVSSILINDFQVQPNEKVAFLYCRLQVPKWAYVGQATVYVSALTAPIDKNGTSYCPGVSTSFYLLSGELLTVRFHDVAVVSVLPSVTAVEAGQTLNVSVTVQNEATEVETLNVSAFCDGIPFGTSGNMTLPPYSHLTLDFMLNTSSFEIGNHTLSAFTPYLADEADQTDNLLVDGSVEIRTKSPTIVHDIAIVDVKVSNNSVYIGDQLQINVSILNKGNATETFNVEVHYNSSLAGISQSNPLESNTLTTLIFAWNTSYALEGVYQITASAPLAYDVNNSDNTFVDGFVEVKSKPNPPPPNVFHDVAVLNAYPSAYLAYIGDTVDVTVVVKNLGNYTESFNVTARTGAVAVKTSIVQDLGSGAERTVVFHWNTTQVHEGDYIVSASASHVSSEVNYENNDYVDGTVRVVAAPSREFPPDWFYWFLSLLFLILLALLLLALWYRRRKRSEAEFYSGWTAWYYGYDLPSRSTKTSMTTKRSRQRITRR
jgi:hypothetical protein